MRQSKDPDASTAFLSRHSFSRANIPETFLREPEASCAFLERSNDDGTLVRTVSVPATPIAAWEDVGNANDASESAVQFLMKPDESFKFLSLEQIVDAALLSPNYGG
jgi:hypothetical protein